MKTFYPRFQHDPQAAEISELYKQARAIIQHLPGWSLSCPYPHLVIATHETGLRISLANDRTDTGRLRVSQSVQNWSGWTLFTSMSPPPSITVAKARGTEAIARDIKRRLLPKAFEKYKEETEYLNRIHRRMKQKEQIQATLASLFDGYVATHRNTVYPNGAYPAQWEAQITNPDTIKITCIVSDLESAADILAAIIEAQNKEETP